MFIKFLIAFVALLAILAIVISLRPADFRVTRSAVLNAPPGIVFPHVNDLHKWQEWSPWAKMDPAAKNTFEGPAVGKGSVFKWSGNNQIGEGIMTVLDSEPDNLVRFNLEFIKPFKGTNTAEFTFKPEGAQTAITWTMFGKNNFMGKAFSLFVDCDKMVGGQFEQGLADLKAIAEKEAGH